MNLFGMMESSGGAMEAERMRAEVVAANMANAETTRTASGGPYHRQHVVFAANQGQPGFADALAAASNPPPFPQTSLLRAAAGLNATDDPLETGVHIAGVIEDPAPPLRR